MTWVVTTPAAARTPRTESRPFVSLLSDWGVRDPSAAICRGVILSIAPDALLVDITHDVDEVQHPPRRADAVVRAAVPADRSTRRRRRPGRRHGAPADRDRDGARRLPRRPGQRPADARRRARSAASCASTPSTTSSTGCRSSARPSTVATCSHQLPRTSRWVSPLEELGPPLDPASWSAARLAAGRRPRRRARDDTSSTSTRFGNVKLAGLDRGPARRAARSRARRRARVSARPRVAAPTHRD